MLAKKKSCLLKLSGFFSSKKSKVKLRVPGLQTDNFCFAFFIFSLSSYFPFLLIFTGIKTITQTNNPNSLKMKVKMEKNKTKIFTKNEIKQFSYLPNTN